MIALSLERSGICAFWTVGESCFGQRKCQSQVLRWAVNIPLDRQLIVAALSDGTVRWYRLRDGIEVLALFIHPDGRRWITWTPQGYYDASAGADELIGWHVNNGWDRAPDFYPVARFRDRFYRPDVIARVLDTLDINEAVSLADKESGRGSTPKAAIGSSLPPTIRIVLPTGKYATADENLGLTYDARTRKDDPVTADGSLGQWR